jgi:hypothetical protein
VKEDVFFYELMRGTYPYTVGCWINETTTVRALQTIIPLA